MDEEELRIRRKFRDDFAYYAPRCLKIRAKSGAVIPFRLNKAQIYLHQRAEDQLKRTGKVRIYIVKGRQQGCSTYVEGRFYWKVSHRFGVQAFILTHRDDATQNLFDIANRYHEHCPAVLRPRAGKSNEKELQFDLLDSGYKVGTAKAKGTGRSATIQFFHGSEVAFWSNPDDHVSGILQAIPNAPGTEVFLESTACGMGNFFHKGWQKAESRVSEFEAVFIPWYWQDEYRLPVPADFDLSQEDIEYMEAYGLDKEQMAWRANKIVELEDPILFKQEYPATPAEAFQVTGMDSFIKAGPILRARKTIVPHPQGPTLVGVDPARFGDDTTDIIYRRGRAAFDLERHSKKDTMEVAGRCRVLLEKTDPYIDCMFIDVGGLGAGIYDRLKEMADKLNPGYGFCDPRPGVGARVRAVNYGGSPANAEKYKNKRAEIWGDMRDWLDGDLPVQLPDDDILHADLMGPQYKYDSATRLVLESKEDMKKRGVRSPNSADALAQTFAEPVKVLSELEKAQIQSRQKQGYDPLKWQPGGGIR